MVYFNREELQKSNKKNDSIEQEIKDNEFKANSGEILIEDYKQGDHGFIIPNYEEPTAFYNHEIIIEDFEIESIETYFLCSGATLKCNQGDNNSDYSVLPSRGVFVNDKAVAVISDTKPMVNIKPFGMCKSMANPTVAAATAANRGQLKKMPCIPNTASPWSEGMSFFLAADEQVPCDKSKCMCTYGGEISVVNVGQNIMGSSGKGSEEKNTKKSNEEDESENIYEEIEKMIFSRNKGFKGR